MWVYLKDKRWAFFMIMFLTSDWTPHVKAPCRLPPKAWQVKLLLSDFKARGQKRVGGRCLKRNRWCWSGERWYHFNLLQCWCQQKCGEVIQSIFWVWDCIISVLRHLLWSSHRSDLPEGLKYFPADWIQIDAVTYSSSLHEMCSTTSTVFFSLAQWSTNALLLVFAGVRIGEHDPYPCLSPVEAGRVVPTAQPLLPAEADVQLG